MLGNLWQDLRYTLRSLRQSPGFTLTAVLSLALGLGLNTTLFTLVDAVVWRPLPAANPAQLMNLFGRVEDPNGPGYTTTSYQDYLDLARQKDVFSGVAGHSWMFATLNRDGKAQMVTGEIVTGNYFDLLGVRPALGRLLLPADDAPGAPPVAVLGYDTWQHEHGGDPAILGKTLKIRNQPYTIVGVAPASFPGLLPGFSAELWLPVSRLEDIEPVGWQDWSGPPTPSNRLEHRGRRWMLAVGRLAPGASVEQARARVELLGKQLAAQYPETNKDRALATFPASEVRVHPAVDGALRPAALALLALVSLVLLVASANVANMVLARTAGRQREIGVRLAIGAGRGRLIRQLLTESLVLSALGGLVGLGMAFVASRLLATQGLPLPIHLAMKFHFDGRVFLFALAVAAATGVLCGLAPALRSSRPDLVSTLKGGSSDGRGGRLGLRGVLVIGQVAVTLFLLVGAGLIVKSLLRSLAAPLGLEPGKVAVATFSLGEVRYTKAQSEAFYRDLLERLRARPEVEGAAVVTRSPLSVNIHMNGVFLDDKGSDAGEEGIPVDVTSTTPGYLKTLGIPLLAGRDIQESDIAGGPAVVVVNQAFAQKYWPGQNPLGKQLWTDRGGKPLEVVGVAATYKVRTPGEAPRPFLQFAFAQNFSSAGTVVVRGKGDPAALAALLKQEIAALEPELPLLECRTFEEMMGSVLLTARIGAALLGALGLLALALAAVGLYGVIAYAVNRRTREIGIRIAVGAQPGSVLGLVLGQGMRLVAIGIALGLPAAYAGTRLAARGFDGLGSFEPLTYTLAAAVLAAVAFVANWLPARKAARIDPLLAIRRE